MTPEPAPQTSRFPSASALLATFGRAVADGVQDFVEGFRNWRVWHLMATNELRRRYARSSLGEFWITLSNAIAVTALGFVWATLWRLPIKEMLPHIAISHILWLYINSFIIEGSGIFPAHAAYYLNQRMAFATSILALAYRGLITLAHNSVIIIGLFFYFGLPAPVRILEALGGLLLLTLCGVLMAYLTALACARYRDLVQLTANVMQIAFFMTPVIWKEELIPAEYAWTVAYNPFAVFLSLVRAPLLNTPLPPERWWIALGILAALLAVAVPLIGRFRNRLIYWI